MHTIVLMTEGWLWRFIVVPFPVLVTTERSGYRGTSIFVGLWHFIGSDWWASTAPTDV